MGTPPPMARRIRRRGRPVRLLAVTLTGGLALAVLPALPAQAALTAPGNNATVSGRVTITESGASNNCTLGQGSPYSRVEVRRASDNAVVHTARRDDTGTLTTTWNAIGQPRGQYVIRSWIRNSVRSGFLNLGCTNQSESAQPVRTVTLANGSAVDVSLPARVVTGEDLTVTVNTRHASTGVSSALGERPVTIEVPGVGTEEVTTDAAGVASATFDLPDLPAGSLTVTAVAGEDDHYLGSAPGSATTSLAKRATRVFYRGDTRVDPGRTARLEAQLVDATPGSERLGDPLSDEPLSLVFEGQGEEVVTTASGRAIREVAVSGPSRMTTAGAAYAGDGVYAASDDEVVFYVGDDAGTPAPVVHGPIGGLTSLLGSLLGGVTGIVTGTDKPLSLGELVGLLTGGDTPLDDLVSMVDSGVVHLLDSTGLQDLLTQLNDGLVTTVREAGRPVDAIVEGLVSKVRTGTPLDDLLDVTSFQWRSVYVDGDGKRLAREFRARMGVPEPIDVTGDGAPDLLANVSLVTGAVALGYSGSSRGLDLDIDPRGSLTTIVPRLEIARLGDVAAPLPASVQAVLELPGASESFRFGYDAREGTAPRGFRADVVLDDEGAALQVASTASGALKVSGAVDADASAAGAEQRFAAAFSEAPRSATVAVELGSTQNLAASLTTDKPTDIEVSFDDDSGGAKVFRAGVELAQVDGTVSFGLAGDTADGLAASVEADRPLPSLRVEGREVVDGRPVTDLLLGLTDVPRSLAFELGADGQGSLTASAPVTEFEVGYGQNRMIQTLDDPAYLNLVSDTANDTQSIGLKLPGFEGMDLALGDDSGELGIDLRLAPTPLHVVVDQDGLQLDAHVLDAPGRLALALGESGAVTVEGSAPIDLVRIQAHDADGIFDGATDLDLRIEEIPGLLQVQMEGEKVRFGTGGQPIGLLELNAHGGTALPMPTEDGLTVRTGPTGTTLAGRITGLREIEAGLGGMPEVLLDTVAGKVFTLGLEQTDDGGAVTGNVNAVIDHLVPHLRLGLQDDGSGAMSLQYRASEPTNSLSFDFDGLQGSIADPLPASLDVCMAGDEACLPGAGIANPELGTIRFAASEHTTLNLVDPSSGMDVRNLRVRLLELTGSLDIDNGGDVYLNTTEFDGECGFDGCRHPILGGSVRVDLGG
ncbi:Ig-like domain-containing protein, partial [Nocardioides massiliensis]